MAERSEEGLIGRKTYSDRSALIRKGQKLVNWVRRYRIKRENFEIRSDEDVLRYNASVEAYIFNMPDSEFDESMSELIDYEVSDEQVKKRAEEIVKRLNDGEDRYDVLYGKDRVL